MASHLSPHDRYIRTMMKGGNLVVAKQFFEANLPADLRGIVDLKTLQAKPNSFIDDKLKLQITDLLYSADFSGEIGYLYLLIEHMSRSEHLLPMRMAKYVLAVMEQHIDETGDSAPPIVAPIILYNGDKEGRGYQYSTDLFELFGKRQDLAKKLIWGPYHLVDLTEIPDDKLRDPIIYGLVARLMKNIRRKGFGAYFESIASDIQSIEKIMGSRYTNSTLTYVFEAGEIEDYDKFVKVIKRELPQIEEEKLMTLAEQFIQKGVEEGLKQGRAEGIFEGEQIGLTKGRAECKKILALELLRDGQPKEKIMKWTGLTEKEIEELE